MKIITRQSCADEATARWRERYGHGRYGPDKVATLTKLQALPTPVDPDEVDRIIGNTSWTKPSNCSECGAAAPVVAQVGQEPDYNSYTAYLCLSCLRDAVEAMTKSLDTGQSQQ